MTVNYQSKAPGVYVEEVKSTSLSVTSGDTAVPIFAATTTDYGFLGAASGAYVELNSWLDVTTKIGVANRGSTLFRALQAYFMNGGGRCYVCDVDSLDSVVPQLSDVTLLVQAGVPSVPAQADAKKGYLTAATIEQLCKKPFSLFAILDTLQGADALTSDGDVNTALVKVGGGSLKNENVAFYYPWLKDGDAFVPPSAVMAGIYAKVDAERGVWKAPANVAVQGLSVATPISDDIQGKLNSHTTPINVIRRFGNDAPVVWGARTADIGSALKYVPVRRLFNALERDIKRSMRLAVFEPNTSATWEKVRSSIDHYLYEIWRRGGLMGTTPNDAYRVLIGEHVTMSEEDIQNGHMIAEVAVAAARPAEFIILRFSEKMVAP
jgi:phage tail sheath protein FI